MSNLMMTRRPTHPGVFIRRVLKKLKINQDELAVALDTSRFTVNQIIGGKRRVTADMAVRLAYVLGNSAELWLGLQIKLDLYEAKLEFGTNHSSLSRIKQTTTILS